MKTQTQNQDQNEKKTPKKKRYLRWIILFAAFIGMGILGYTFLRSYKTDLEEAQSSEVISEQTESAEFSQNADAEEPMGMIGPRQMMIILAIPLFAFIFMGPGMALGDIYTGKFSDNSRTFWMWTVILLLSVGSLAYLVIGRKQRIGRR